MGRQRQAARTLPRKSCTIPRICWASSDSDVAADNISSAAPPPTRADCVPPSMFFVPAPVEACSALRGIQGKQIGLAGDAADQVLSSRIPGA
jgi:hypothetical protein